MIVLKYWNGLCTIIINIIIVRQELDFSNENPLYWLTTLLCVFVFEIVTLAACGTSCGAV